MGLISRIATWWEDRKPFDFKIEIDSHTALSYHYGSGFVVRSNIELWLRTHVGRDQWTWSVPEYNSEKPPLCCRGLMSEFRFKNQSHAVLFMREFGGRL